MRVLLDSLPLLFILVVCSFSVAQSSTSSILPTSSASATTSTRSTSQTASEVTSLPPNGTVTLSANGTATTTIVNGTAVNATSTPTSTSTSATSFPSLGGVSSCVVSCLQDSVSQANCSAITDVACFCSSATFRNATVECVSTQCPSDLSSAESLAQQFCGMVSVTLTFPAPTVSGSAPATSTRSGNGATEIGHASILTTLSIVAGLVWIISGC